MANSTQVKTGLNTLIQTHFSSVLKNTLFNRMPLPYFLLSKEGDKTGADGLGVPKTGLFLTGVNIPRAKREEVLGSRIYEPIVQVTLPAIADGKVMGMYDTLPLRQNWTATSPSTYFARPRVKWVERADPYEVPNKDIRTTSRAAKNEIAGWQAVTSLYTAETKSVLGQHLMWWNQSMWGTTGNGYPSNEDATVWDSIHSLQYAIHDSNTYCGVDRSVSANSYWRGNRVTSSTAADFESLINYCNYDLGLSKKGTGIDLLLMDGSNFKKVKLEAKTKGFQLIYSGGIPDFGEFGFKRELVKIDNTWCVYDPECPTGHVAALNLETWTIAIHPDANFRVSEAFDQSKIKGGDDSTAGTVRTEMMVVCEVPSLNAYFTAVS